MSAGDLFEDERITEDTAQFLRSTFAALQPLPVYLAPGNHDWFGPRSPYGRVDWSPNVCVFAEDRLTPVSLADGVTLWGAAHRAPANTNGYLDGFRVNRGGVNLALFHGSLLGGLPREGVGKVAHAPFSDQQIADSGLHHAFVGHFHRPSTTRWHTYPGNPNPLTFGEDGSRGAVVAHVRPDGSVQVDTRAVAMAACHDLPLDVTGCVNLQAIRTRLAGTLSGLMGVARVTLSGELAPQVDLRLADLQTVPNTLDGLVLRVGRLRVAYNFDPIRLERTARGQFVNDVAAANLDEDDRRRVLVTGLRALEGRDDLEVL